jgi:hypothetical protein
MRGLMLLLALGIGACEQKAPEGATVPAPAAPDATLPGQAPAKSSAEVVPKPKDQAQLDRMILAGYTPHGDHMHAPGVNKCPLSKDSEAVM